MSVAVWVGYPRSYTPGRTRAPQYVVLHYTAGSEGPTSAEGGAQYDKTRTDGTSTHYFTDSLGPALQEVPEGDRAHAAYFHGNEIGIHIEICGTIQTRAQWLDATSYATLVTTATLTREICERQDFPLKLLTVDETRAAYYGKDFRPKGITDHGRITAAYPEDGGTHTDVGPEFPWDVFMQLVIGTPTPIGGSDMCFVAKSGAGPNGEDSDHSRWWAGDGVFHTEITKAEAEVRIAIMHLYGMPGAAILSWGDSSPEAVQRNIGPIPAGNGAGGAAGTPLTYDQTVAAVVEGANQAEDT